MFSGAIEIESHPCYTQPRMSELTSSEISHLARLARITLSSEEEAKFAQELPRIVEFVEQLQKVKLDDDLATSVPTPLSAMREDVVSSDHLTLEQLEALAPDWQGGQVVVPAVFGEEADA